MCPGAPCSSPILTICSPRSQAQRGGPGHWDVSPLGPKGEQAEGHLRPWDDSQVPFQQVFDFSLWKKLRNPLSPGVALEAQPGGSHRARVHGSGRRTSEVQAVLAGPADAENVCVPLSGILPDGYKEWLIMSNFTTIKKKLALIADGPPQGASCVAPGQLTARLCFLWSCDIL